MPALAPDALIARHIEKLRSRPDNERIAEVLARAGLEMKNDVVTHDGRPATTSDCYAYKQSVREIYGDATYAFTKVNFVLGGCGCRDCSG